MELCHTCIEQQALVVALLQVLLQHYLCRHYSQPVYDFTRTNLRLVCSSVLLHLCSSSP